MEGNWKQNYIRYRQLFLNIWAIYNAKPNLSIYLELVLSILTVGILAYFAIRPTVLTILELNSTITAKEETVAKLEQKVRNLQSANQELVSQASRIELVKQAVPERASPEIFINQISTLSSQSSVNILAISIADVDLVGKNPSAPQKTEEVAKLPTGSEGVKFNISASGDYASLNNFIDLLEKLRRPIKFDGLSINTSLTDSGKILVLSISGRLPFLRTE